MKTSAPALNFGRLMADEALAFDPFGSISIHPLHPAAPARAGSHATVEPVFTVANSSYAPWSPVHFTPAPAPPPVKVVLAPSTSTIAPGLGFPLQPSGSTTLATTAEPRLSQAQVDALETGFTSTLGAIQTNLAGQVFAETLPVLGNNLQAASGSAAQLKYVTALQTAIVDGLGTLTGAADYTEAQIESAINGKLATAGITGAGVAIDLADPANPVLGFATAKSFAALTVPVEGDLGLPNLGLRTSGNAQSSFSYQFDFEAGLDGGGFYLGTAPAETVFKITTETKLAGFNQTASLADLPVLAADNGTDFDGVFAVTLVDPNGDGKLRSGELSGSPDLLDATLSGLSNLQLKLASNLPVSAALPKVGTELGVQWSFSDAPIDARPTDHNADFGDAPTVSFANNTVNLGSFFNGFAGDALQQITRITQPLKPVIDVLTTPIPILSDLGSSKVTLLDFAGVDAGAVSAIEGLKDISDLTQLLATFNGNDGVLIKLGSLTLDGDLRSELAEDVVVNLLNAPALSGQNANLTSFLAEVAALGGGGLSFPLLSDPTAIGELFLGQDVDLFNYAPAPVGFDVEYSQFFPVLGVIGVKLGGHFGFSFQFDIGFDTQGLRDFIAGGAVDPGEVFNGFYVRGFDEASAPVTGFSVSAGLIAGLEGNIGIANIGAEGDLTATVTFHFDSALDPDGDGKIRGDTLVSTDLDDLFDPSGEITTGLRAYLEVGIDPFSIEFSFESPRVTLLSFNQDDAKPNLATFGGNGDLFLNVGPRSAQRLVGNLTDRPETYLIQHRYDPLLEDPQGLTVAAFNSAQATSFPARIVGDGGEKSDKLEIAADVNIPVVFTGGPSRDVLTGGAAADSLSGDDGPDVLSGNGGNDTLRGGKGSDVLIGGSGADILDGGDAGDVAPFPVDTASYVTAVAGMTIDLRTGIFTGDGAGDIFISIERYAGTNFDDTINGDDAPNSLLSGLDGADVIRGFAGSDLLDGGKGDDTLEGGANDDFLIGGPGADALDGGNGIDSLAYSSSKSPVAVSLRTGLGTGGDAQGDTLVSIEVLYGSPLPADLALRYTFDKKPIPFGTGDTLEGGDGPDKISGFGGADFIDGGAGDDLLYGDAAGTNGNAPSTAGFDVDTIRGGLGHDTLFGQQDDDDLDGGPGNDLLDGGTGHDLLTMDAAGIDHADAGADFDALSADFSTQVGAIIWDDRTPTPFLFPDGRSAVNFETLKNITTSSGNDFIYLASPPGFPVESLPDRIARLFYANTIVTGAGNDTVYSGAYADTVDLGEGDDFVNGGTGDTSADPNPEPPGHVKFPRFNPSTQAIEGLFGNTLLGGPGIDTVSFDGQAREIHYAGGSVYLGVTVNLATGATGGSAIHTGISGFERIIGTDYGDDLTGDAGANYFDPLRGGGEGRNHSTRFDIAGPDRIDGGDGEDTLHLDFSRNDSIDAGAIVTAGSSMYRLALRPVENPDTGDSYSYTSIEHLEVTGASKDDVIYAYQSGFSDTLSGRGGNDSLGGNGGADTLLGGDGNDVLHGQSRGVGDPTYPGTAGGRDLFEGGAGDDLVEDVAFNVSSFGGFFLSAGALFQLDGGTGFDRLSADFSNQTAPIVWTSAAPENLEFADGAYARDFEQLRYFATGSGYDSITQAGRVDNLFTLGAGDDVLNPGIGTDFIYGGAGNDLLILDYREGDSPAALGVDSSFDGFEGIYRRRDPVTNVQVEYVSFREIERLHVTGGSHNDTLTGLAGDDTLLGGGDADILKGQGGNNHLDGGDGNDTLTVGAGTNTLIGGAGNDTITGGTGNETISGDAGDDTIFAGDAAGSDTITGGAGNDLITANYFPNNSAGYGVDFFDGGEGDDVITDGYFTGTDRSDASAGSRLKLEGGAGFDKLSADFGKQTQPITFLGGQGNSRDFADGSYFRNFEAIGDFIAGAGADMIVQPGRVDNFIAGREGNDTINPGLGIDVVFGGDGIDLIIVDFSVGDGPNVGGVVNEGAFVRRRDLLTGAILDSLTSQGFERVEATGGSKGDSLAGGNLADIFHGNAGNDIIDGNGGDDLLDGGAGADTLRGGAGNDSYTVDNIADIITENAGAGNDTVNAIISYTLGANVENLTLLGTALNGAGNALANLLTGNAKSNFLSGADGNDILLGGFGIGLPASREVDRLAGGAGADMFILGDASGRFYDDRSSLSPGRDGYARIDDFTPGQGDKLKLKGAASEYFLAASGVSGVPGSGLFHDTNANHVYDASFDELIAVLDSAELLSHANTIDAAIFV